MLDQAVKLESYFTFKITSYNRTLDMIDLKIPFNFEINNPLNFENKYMCAFNFWCVFMCVFTSLYKHKLQMGFAVIVFRVTKMYVCM